MKKQLKVLAVSAPHWPCRTTADSKALNSRVPFSLQNACRVAAGLALSQQGVWGESNWRDRESLNANVVMYDYAGDLSEFKKKLKEVRPNLLLIGAMTLSLPGAIRIARLAKTLLDDEITVVLGGKHASETIYLEQGYVRNNPGSPLRLMSEGKIPSYSIDVVISGDGEYVVAQLGELVSKYGSARNVVANLDELKTCPGNWIAGYLVGDEIQTIKSNRIPIDYSTLPIPAETFGFQGSFAVFDADRTAHAYSDISRGCMYNCSFCTERMAVNGPIRLKGSAYNLARQLVAVAKEGELKKDRVSAFVEDSILLMASPKELNRLHQLLADKPLIPFGGQITVPLFLRKETRDALIALKDRGLCYLYAGMETGSETIAQAMSKNVGKSGGSWMSRNEQVLKLATEAGFKYGIAVLFGLGESQSDRIHQLEELVRWQHLYAGNPCVVSLNWATQHPLLDVGNFDYIEWGTSADSELLPYFQEMFGEASEKYLVSQQKPAVAELEEIRQLFNQLKLQQ